MSEEKPLSPVVQGIYTQAAVINMALRRGEKPGPSSELRERMESLVKRIDELEEPSDLLRATRNKLEGLLTSGS